MVFAFDIDVDRQRFLLEIANRFANILTAVADIEEGTGRLLVRIEFEHPGTREAAFKADFRTFALTFGGAPV